MSAWLRFLARRLSVSIGLVFVVTSLVFALTYALPADPARAMVGPHADAATLASVRTQMCLDRPFISQYGCFLSRISRGDLGTSFRTRQPVVDLLAERVGPTVELALAAIFLQLVLSVPIAATAASKRGRWFDRVTHMLVVILQNVPTFVLGPALIYFAAFRLDLLPVGGRGENGLDRLRHLVLPALTVAIASVASYTRLLRNDLVDVLDKEYIRTARAKGAGPGALWFRHIAPNAAGPMVALLGMDLGTLLGGAAVTEYIFGWPGLGREAVLGILEIDLPVILGVVVIAATAVVLSNLLADIVFAVIDPRQRPR